MVAVQVEQGGIWILFAGAEASRIHLSLHRGRSDGSRPADAYVVTGGGLSRSARRAAEAVYNWLRQTGLNPDRFVAGFDVAGADSTMVGESGGLAFAIALTATILNREGVSVAATGEILGAHYPALLGPVDGINDKVRAAALLLGPGSYLCFPAENAAELEPALRRDLEDKGVVVVAADTVAEALDSLFGTCKAVSPRLVERPVRSRRRIVLGLCGALAAAGLGLAWLIDGGSDATLPAPVPAEVSVSASAGLPAIETDSGQPAAAPDQPGGRDTRAGSGHGFD